jgi:hypothetical protein
MIHKGASYMTNSGYDDVGKRLPVSERDTGLPFTKTILS